VRRLRLAGVLLVSVLSVMLIALAGAAQAVTTGTVSSMGNDQFGQLLNSYTQEGVDSRRTVRLRLRITF